MPGVLGAGQQGVFTGPIRKTYGCRDAGINKQDR